MDLLQPIRLEVTGSNFGTPTEFFIPNKGLPENPTREDIINYISIHHPNTNISDWKIFYGDKGVIVTNPEIFNQSQTGNNQQLPSMRPAVFDVFPHHNQALDVWKMAIGEDKIKPGGVLLHFDTHSDFRRNKYTNEDIGDYINSAVSRGLVSEVYWILPSWTRGDCEARLHLSTSADYEKYYRCMHFWNNPGLGGGAVFLSAGTEYTFYVKDGEIFFVKPSDFDQNPDQYRIVRLHKVTMDELPSFEHSNNVFLDVDADYFSISGEIYDNFNASSEELTRGLKDFIKGIKSHHINPLIVTLARSPGFTPDEDIPIIEDFFRNTFGKEYIKDSIRSYEHSRESSIDQYLLLELQRSLIRLFNIPLLSRPDISHKLQELVSGRCDMRDIPDELKPKSNLERDITSILFELQKRGMPDVVQLFINYIRDPSEENYNNILSLIISGRNFIRRKRW